ncbi:MAG TPA: DUF2225 domain-containing protein [Lachnospiraceae bacterium]|nr:DUF2225 domain-containing protein [Lachnospiraceae bacterium]
MAGLLSGLGRLGLGALENMELYAKEKPEEKKEKEKKAVPVLQEQDFLFNKTHTCPICDKEFKSRTVKVGKERLIGSDADLRPRHEHVDMLKYDVIVCPRCGYAALSRYFKFLTLPQARFIKEKISANFRPRDEDKREIYTYDEALDRYKLALVNAIVKMAKPSEKAYICLKTAWLLRGKGEHLDKEDEKYEEKKKKIDEDEREFLKNALDGFLEARQTENFPMCGMDESTVDYIIAVTAAKFEQYDVATKMISGVITSPNSNSRMKDRARTFREQMLKEIKAKSAAGSGK